MTETVERIAGELPWYRHLWPWLLMLPPVAAVGGGVAMLWLATHTPAPLVVEDYAQIEAITAARFAADDLAMRRGLEAQIRIERSSPGKAQMTIRLHEESGDRPAGLRLQFRHATDASLDRTAVARPLGNEFVAQAALGNGTYLVEIEPPDGAWRLAARVRPGDRVVDLGSNRSANGTVQSPEHR